MYALLYPCKFKTLGVFTITINLMIDLPVLSYFLYFVRLAVPSFKNCSCLHCSFFQHRKLMKRYFVNKTEKEGLIAKCTCFFHKCLLSSVDFSAIAIVAA